MSERLLHDMIIEIGITDEIFAKACIEAAKNPNKQRIVDQLISLDDYMHFKSIMFKRNAYLNKKATK